MAVALNSQSSAATNSGTGQTAADHANLTVGAALSNSAIGVIAIFDTLTVSNAAFHWDSAGTNQLLTNLGSKAAASGAGVIVLAGGVAPTAGNKNLHATWTGSAEITLFILCFTGVDQTGGATSFPNFLGAAATSAAPTVTITSASGDAVFGGLVCAAAAPTSGNSTNLFNNGGAVNTNNSGGEVAGAATVAFAGALSASDPWAIAGVDVKAAGAGGGSKLRRNSSLSGLGASGPFFHDPLSGKSQLGWRPSLVAVKRKLIVPPRHIERLAA